MKYINLWESFLDNNDKALFLSKTTGQLVLEIENINNTFVYWFYDIDDELDSELLPLLSEYDNTNELTYEEGINMISYVKSLYGDYLDYDGNF